LRLLLDEHISLAVAKQLRGRGHDVVVVVDVGLGGVADLQVLSWAAANRRVVVTSNIQDFRPLHAMYLTTGMTHYGIVLVPTGKYSLKRESLGALVTALDRLLTRLPADDGLCDTEQFL